MTNKIKLTEEQIAANEIVNMTKDWNIDWSITDCKCIPIHKRMKFVISGVEWVVVATDNKTTKSFSIGGLTTLPLPDNKEGFSTFSKVKEQDVIDWIKKEVGELNIVQGLKAGLDRMNKPTLVSKTLTK